MRGKTRWTGRTYEEMEEWWEQLFFNVRRAWLSLSDRLRLKSRSRSRSRARARTNVSGSGLLKLRDEVQTCEYQDVQVMWEMLRNSESQPDQTCTACFSLNKNRPFCKGSMWTSNKKRHSSSSSSVASVSADNA